MDVLDIKTAYDELQKEYEEIYNETLDMVFLDGKLLKVALKEQLPLTVRWEVFTKKLDRLYENSVQVVEETYAEAIDRVYKAERHRDMTLSEVKERARLDKAYRTARTLSTEARTLRDEARGILEVVVSRKYILNNMANAIIAGVQDTIL